MPRGYGGFDSPEGPSPYMTPEDALIAKLRNLRGKLQEAGFSEVETGRIADTFLRHWSAAIMEGGSSGSTGV